MPESSPADDLLGFVRGDRSLVVLERFGVTVTVAPELEATFPSGLPHVSASLADLASGLEAAGSSPDTGRIWAFVVLASDVEFPDPEQSREAETLHSALWDLSFGKEPSGEALAVIEAMAGGSKRATAATSRAKAGRVQVFAVVRFDRYLEGVSSGLDLFAVKEVWPTEADALRETDRLNRAAEDGVEYATLATRFFPHGLSPGAPADPA